MRCISTSNSRQTLVWQIALCSCWSILQFAADHGCAQEALEPAKYFVDRVAEIEEKTQADLSSLTPQNREQRQDMWREELAEMLGLKHHLAASPRSDLATTFVGSIHLDRVRVERLHYQALPGLYVAANLYLPQDQPQPQSGWPAVLYVCGHARVTDHGRLLGNKTNYQHHGLWLARHGVVCLMIDTIQLGEFHGEHHGTYKLGRWDWIARGFTPAGVETWNAIRGLDVLCELPQVDGNRIGITGRSGGGAYSWFTAALDQRIQVAVPVAGITDLRDHVLGGCVEGHCDCMYFTNYFAWDYSKLAALIAPRALLLENSDRDSIFPLSGVMRIDAALRELYQTLGADEQYGLVITPGAHKDTQDLQVPAFRWLLRHLSVDEDPQIERVATREIDNQRLAVFEAEIPQDQRVNTVAEWFVPQASGAQDRPGNWTNDWLPQIKRLGIVHDRCKLNMVPQLHGQHSAGTWTWFQDASEGVGILHLKPGARREGAGCIVHLVLDSDLLPNDIEGFLKSDVTQSRLQIRQGCEHYFVRWRGADWHSGGWSRGDRSVKKRNQIARRFYLLGASPESVALNDLRACLPWIANHQPSHLELAGTGREALLTTLATLTSHDLEGSHIERLYLGDDSMGFPDDPQLTACLPGLLQIVQPQQLLATVANTVDLQRAAIRPYSKRLLVDSSPEPQQATGIRIVEVSADSAMIWMRATRWPLPNLGDLPAVQFTDQEGKHGRGAVLPELGVDGLRFAAPGVAAEARIGWKADTGSRYQYSTWQAVSPTADYSILLPLHDLAPATRYQLRAELRAPGGNTIGSVTTGSFRTLPDASTSALSQTEQNAPLFRLAVSTCQGFPDRDGPHGFDMYRTIQARGTHAFVMAGDVVYYDRLARSVPLAHYHWQRTYSLPTLVDFHRRVPTYFLKDDHDTYVNDSWPGEHRAWTDDFHFSDGQRIFKQQTGLPTPAYRTLKIGGDLQLWLMEGRDYRSPNPVPDGPQKTIWGTQQIAWLEETLRTSTARFKVIISPTPIVGPDRENKRDNHSNQVFEREGERMRQLLSAYPNTVSICGDRHWQFHSVDPATGLHEFSVGPASDRHAGGWKQSDFRPEIHKFLRVAGGYLELELQGGHHPELVLRHLDIQGNEQHQHVLN